MGRKNRRNLKKSERTDRHAKIMDPRRSSGALHQSTDRPRATWSCILLSLRLSQKARPRAGARVKAARNQGIRREMNMDKEITIKINMEPLDEATEKANRLIALLREIDELVDSLFEKRMA
ncbi:hypothetical protein [Anaerotruncus rubiinfantis]|uniref:hypothetical protein n=1 Tax=Anaerotruncus rubiinfantis TaxID=1720200 RepID=UPI003D7A6A6F